jgi:hypothetical protein
VTSLFLGHVLFRFVNGELDFLARNDTAPLLRLVCIMIGWIVVRARALISLLESLSSELELESWRRFRLLLRFFLDLRRLDFCASILLASLDVDVDRRLRFRDLSLCFFFFEWTDSFLLSSRRLRTSLSPDRFDVSPFRRRSLSLLSEEERVDDASSGKSLSIARCRLRPRLFRWASAVPIV